MVNQHAKWLRTTNRIEWRRPIPSLNYLLTSHVWRQDHNGFSHQDPGFIDHVVNKKSDVIRVYLPPDANTLLSVADHCLRTRQYINVIVAGKQPQPQYLSIEDAIVHCTKGIGIWDWAGTDRAAEPDVYSPAQRRSHHGNPRRSGDPPRMVPRPADPGGERCRPHASPGRPRTPARITRRRFRRPLHHRHTRRVRLPRVPWLIHRLTYRRRNHDNIHVRGYIEEAPPQPRSTCASSTGSTASIWHWTSSTASNASARPPPTPANT